MSRAGVFSKFTVSIFTREGRIPYFRVCQGNPENPTWETCVKIEKSEYFHHGPKTGVLNSSKKKELMTFLKAKYSGALPYSETNWGFVIGLWNINNPNSVQLPLDIKMPDYTELQ